MERIGIGEDGKERTEDEERMRKRRMNERMGRMGLEKRKRRIIRDGNRREDRLGRGGGERW